MNLNELQPAEGSKFAPKRVGRGIGSGTGKTSGKGHKGQNARSGGGVRPGFEGGQMPLYRRLPKRGFKNIFAKQYVAVNVEELNKLEDGAEVTAETLKANGIISKTLDGVKILGRGELNKKLTVKVAKMSASAKEKIEKAGRNVENSDLRRRILFTLMMLIVFRFGAHIPVPYLTADAMQAFLGNGGTDLFSLFDVFTGGAFSNATVMAMGVSPYINASIIVQLLTVAIPSLERLAKEGLEGRKKINKITRYLGIALAFIQGAGLYVTLYNMSVTNGLDAIKNPSVLTFFVIVLTFTAGTAFIIWLGELITEKGLGNGVSLIIFAGIVSRIPSAAYGIYNQFLGAGVNAKGLIFVAAIIVVAIAAITFVVFFSEAERRIPVQYAKRVVGRKMYGGQSTNIPIKVAAGGVMPIIFASSIMAFPATIVRLVSGGNMPTAGLGYYILGCLSAGYASAWWTSLVYAILYALLILFFTYFYSSIQFNPIELANNMKKSGGYIPGIRPGKPTSDYIGKISSRLNLVGAFFLAIIAILPVIVGAIFNVTALQIGGTSLLIMEGVALETVRQIESQMTMRHYKGFLE